MGLVDKKKVQSPDFKYLLVFVDVFSWLFDGHEVVNLMQAFAARLNELHLFCTV